MQEMNSTVWPPESVAKPATAREPCAGFVALSRFVVANGMIDEVKAAFRNRPHLVEEAPGFVRMEVLSPLDRPEEVWLMTYWSDEGISVTIPFHLRALRELVTMVRNTPACAKVKVLVGGYPFRAVPDLWRKMGADGSAPDAQLAIAAASQLLNSNTSRPCGARN